MRKLILVTAATTLMTGAAWAQAVQTGVTGESGDPEYSVQVTASDGQTYNCKPEIETVAGVPTRTCVPAGGSGGLFGEGGGIGAGAGAAVVALVVLGVAAGGGSSSTTTGSIP